MWCCVYTTDMFGNTSEAQRPDGSEPTTNHTDVERSRRPQPDAAAVAVASSSAETMRCWRWEDGGWDTLFGEIGGRLAAFSYQVGAQATTSQPSGAAILSPEDLIADSDGRFNAPRVEELRNAAISAELNRTSELMERLVLAMEVSFDTGLRHGAQRTSQGGDMAPADGDNPSSPADT